MRIKQTKGVLSIGIGCTWFLQGINVLPGSMCGKSDGPCTATPLYLTCEVSCFCRTSVCDKRCTAR